MNIFELSVSLSLSRSSQKLRQSQQSFDIKIAFFFFLFSVSLFSKFNEIFNDFFFPIFEIEFMLDIYCIYGMSPLPILDRN